jgi:hypothetical protein
LAIFLDEQPSKECFRALEFVKESEVDILEENMPVSSTDQYLLAGYKALVSELRSWAKDLQDRTFTQIDEVLLRQEASVEIGERLEELLNSYLGKEE